jgi:DNA-binding NarL/FixJ family response regulator
VSVRVLVVDDHELLAQSLTAALIAEGLDVVRAIAFDPPAVLAAAAQGPADVVLLDLWLADKQSTLPLVGPLHDLGARVVMVTGEVDRVALAECIEAGAVGVVAKSEPFERLVAAVLDVVAGRPLLADVERDSLLAGLRTSRGEAAGRLAPFERLSPREAEVLRELIHGRPAETIATTSFVSILTVRAQIRSILSKLGVTSQLAAVSMARQAGWLP